MAIIIKVFGELGIPLAPGKIEGPSTCLPYLGICINSIKMEIRLPEDKLIDLRIELHSWHDHKKCKKRDLLSLISKLSFAAKVVPAGRSFTRQLIDISKTVSRLHHHITLSQDAKQDIRWWLDFLPRWNGISLIQQNNWELAKNFDL